MTKKKGKALPEAGGGTAVAELPLQVEVVSLGREDVALEDLHDSTINPRSVYDEASLQGLASAMRRVGWLGEALARPRAAGGREIVCGHRRKRAAAIAGLKTVRVEVRELTDQQALDCMMAENLERDNLHPLEEADGFHRMIEQRKAAEIEAGQPAPPESELVADVSARSGRAARFVRQRLRLLDLIVGARAPFLAGTIGLRHAFVLAGMSPTDQAKALQELLASPVRNDGEVWTVGEFMRHVELDILLDLSEAPWKLDDETLVPAAGSCTACPKRTGAMTELFDGADKDDRCADATCFASKRQTLVDRSIEQVRNKQLAKFPEVPKGGYAHPADVLLIKTGYSYGGDKVAKTAKEAIAKQIPLRSSAFHDASRDTCEFSRAAVIAEGKSHDGDKTGQIRRVCVHAGCPVHDPRAKAKARKADPKEKAAAEKLKRQRALERAEEVEMLRAIAGVWRKKGPSAEDLLELVECMWSEYTLEDRDREILVSLHGWTEEQEGIADELPKGARTLDVRGLEVLILEIALCKGDLVPSITAKRLKVDAKAVTAAAKASLAAEEAPEEKTALPPPKATKKPASKKKGR